MGYSLKTCAVVVLVGVIAWVPGCRKTPPPGMADEAKAIRASVLDWAGAIKAGDLDKIVGFYTTDAAMLPAGLSICQGQAMIRQFWADWCSRIAASGSFSVRFDAVDIAASQDIAWSSVTMYHGPSGEVSPFEGKTTWVILHKKVNGKWSVYLTISYAQLPTADEPPESEGDWRPEYSAGMVVPHRFTVSVVGQYIEICGRRFPLTGNEQLIYDIFRGTQRLKSIDGQSNLEIFKEYVVLRMPMSESNGDSVFAFRKRDLKSFDLREGISDTLAFASLSQDGIFYDLEGQYILLDYGTGPDWRGFEVYDLDARKVIYGGEYIENVSFWGDHAVVYTSGAAIDSNAANFPRIKAELDAKEAELKDSGLLVTVVRDFILDLRTLKVTPTGDVKVTVQQ